MYEKIIDYSQRHDETPDPLATTNDIDLTKYTVANLGTQVNTASPNGRLLFHILSAFAEFEREIIRERMQAGRERAKAEGVKLHRPRKDLDTREIKRLYKEIGLSGTAIGKLMGVSTATILSRLREMGVKVR